MKVKELIVLLASVANSDDVLVINGVKDFSIKWKRELDPYTNKEENIILPDDSPCKVHNEFKLTIASNLDIN